MDFYYEFLELNPNPIFIVKPIINKDKCTDFIYEYVNNSFELFLQLDKEELVGKNYTSIFKTSEDSFYDAFYRTVINKEVVVLEDNSPTINKKIKIQCFPINDKICACMILSYNYIDDNLSIVENTNLLKKANKDFF